MYRSLYWNCEEQRSKLNLWTGTLKFVQKESARLLVPEVWSCSFSGLGLNPEINSNLTNISSYSNNDPHINWVLILNTSIYWAVTVFQECIFISFNLYNSSVRWLLLLSLCWVDVAVESRKRVMQTFCVLSFEKQHCRCSKLDWRYKGWLRKQLPTFDLFQSNFPTFEKICFSNKDI